MLSGVLGALGGSLQFGELAVTLGPAGFVNASLLIKVMLPCASAQAVSGGKINRRAAVLQNLSAATGSAQTALPPASPWRSISPGDAAKKKGEFKW